MKSNVIDMRTKKGISYDQPRNTLPGGIFMSLDNLICSMEIEGARCFLTEALKEHAQNLNVSSKDLRALIFIFDRRNSRSFLVNELIEKSSEIFSDQVMFE
jgi:hypothetical protein